MTTDEVHRPYAMLRIVYGVVPIVAGLDKFLHILTDWNQYLSPLVTRFVPAQPFMYAVGVIEIVAGLVVLSRFVRIGAYVVALWLAAIALNLLTTGTYFDIAVRDLVMAAGSLALAQLAPAAEKRHATALHSGQVASSSA